MGSPLRDMKKIKIPILNSEYSVNVYIGKKAELIKEGAKYTTYSPKIIARELDNRRGLAYDLFPDLNPIILIDGDQAAYSAIATLAHESSHAISFIENYLGIKDTNDEFRAHGIGAIMRAVGKTINPLNCLKVKTYGKDSRNIAFIFKKNSDRAV